MISLEEIFLKQAENLNSRIDCIQLRQLLRLKNGKRFDSQLCEELVIHFGYSGTIDFNDFDAIWSSLRKKRQEFEQFSYRGQLCTASFQMLLEQIIHRQLPSEFIRKLVDFYRQQITFDVFVHAVHHIKIITISGSAICPENLMEEFCNSVREGTHYSATVRSEIQPSAPPEEILPSTCCTYI